MTQFNEKKIVGKVIRVEWNKEENSVKLILEITDEKFKCHVLHNKDFEDIITMNEKDVIVVATKKCGE